MKNTTIILDYGYGNIYSLKSSLFKLGIGHIILGI